MGLAGMVLAALLISGCRSSRDSGYADVPQLPPTPVGIPSSSAPGETAATQPAPAVSAASSSSVAAPSTAPTQSAATSSTEKRVVQVSSADPHPVPAGPLARSTSEEVIRVGEALHIVFSDTVTVIPPVDDRVKEDGTITLMFNETFRAAELTPGDLAKEIRRRYVPAYYQQLTATVNREVVRIYYVDGEVRNQSRQSYTGKITVTQAIASASGFTDFANKSKVKLIRANGKTQIVNCKKAIEHPELDPEVFPGDRIHVPRSILW